MENENGGVAEIVKNVRCRNVLPKWADMLNDRRGKKINRYGVYSSIFDVPEIDKNQTLVSHTQGVEYIFC